MYRELMCSAWDHNLPNYLFLNRDKLEQESYRYPQNKKKKNPQSNMCRGKGCLFNVSSEIYGNGKFLQLRTKLDIILNNLTGSCKLKIHNRRSRGEMTKSSQISCFLFEDCPSESSQNCGFLDSPCRVLVIRHI